MQWVFLCLLESSCGTCNEEPSLLCVVKIEIGLACASAVLMLDVCLLEKHYRHFFFMRLHLCGAP